MADKKTKYKLRPYEGGRFSPGQWFEECFSKYGFEAGLQVRKLIGDQMVSSQKIYFNKKDKWNQPALMEMDPNEKMVLYFDDKSKESVTKSQFFRMVNDGNTILPYWIVIDHDFDHQEINFKDQKNPLFKVLKQLDEIDLKYLVIATEKGRGIKIVIPFKDLLSLSNRELEKRKKHIGEYIKNLIGGELKITGDQCSPCYAAKEGEEPTHAKTGRPLKIIHFTGLDNSYSTIKDKVELVSEKLDREELIRDVLANLAMKRPREATELIVEEILGKNKIYSTRDDERSEMWIYSEGIYIPQAKTFIREFCRDILGNAYNSHLGNEVITKIEADTYIDQKEFFGNNILKEICVKDGILNLKTKEITPFTEDKIFFNKHPITYDPKKDCPCIKKHLKAVLKNKEDLPVMEELLGFLLWKEYTIEKAFMFVGEGRNGKGKTLELMKRFLGAENCVNIPLQQFETDPWALGDLFGKLANLSGDLDKRALYKTGAFKNLTGRDLISASRKFLSRVHFENYAKMIFCANELPITYDTTLAFWNRWVLLEFPYIFLSQKELDNLPAEEEKGNYKLADPDIIEKLTTDEELSGLLNLALEGLKRLLKQKDFSYSKSVSEVKEMWIRKSDSFAAFLMDCIEEDYEGKITKQELRKAYSLYCKDHKVTMSGDKTIKQVLTTTYGVSEDRIRSGDKDYTFWSGIRFKGDMGDIGDMGFSTYRQKNSSYKGQKTIGNHVTLGNPKTEKKAGKSQKTIGTLGTNEEKAENIDFNKSGVKEALDGKK